ncbi:MAG: hypothetical protein HY928_02420 [Elusimicrobia bacterium]|nr:hypothetical protein [Elusimicrobiota bacterium]
MDTAAEVVLHLLIEVAPEKRAAFLAFCRRAFPVYESGGGCRMALYEDLSAPGRFDEVGYYLTQADYERGEKAIQEDPAQAALIKEWRSLLKGPPKVSVVKRTPL